MSQLDVFKTNATSTVGRAKAFSFSSNEKENERLNWSDEQVNLTLGDSLDNYHHWETPVTIISDGAYGILGFEGDTDSHIGLPQWYEPHIRKWSQHAVPSLLYH